MAAELSGLWGGEAEAGFLRQEPALKKADKRPAERGPVRLLSSFLLDCFPLESKAVQRLGFSDCHTMGLWLFCELAARPSFHMGPLGPLSGCRLRLSWDVSYSLGVEVQ